jgi:tubulin--tyrosine ligase-like protein 12
MSKEDNKENIKEEEKISGIKEFLSAHELQLYGMQFPKELEEMLYTKLKYEIFDISNYFEIMDNQDENRYLLRSKKNIKKNEFICLIDHCWTYKLRKFNYFCENFPNIIKRATSMLKYAGIRKPIINTLEKEKEIKKNIDEYNNYLAANEEKQKYLNYDEYDITDDNLNLLKINSTKTETLSIEDNKIQNIFFIEDILEKNKNIKALWCSGNPFCEVNEEYEKDFENKFSNLKIINRKFTKNASKWSIELILDDSIANDDNKDKIYYKEYDNLYGQRRFLDLSGRDPLNIKDYSIFSKVNKYKILGIDITDNDYDFSNEETKNKFIKFLEGFTNDLEYLTVDDNDDIFNMEESNEQDGYNIFMDKELLKEINKKIKYINGISINTILSRNDKYENLIQLKRENYVHKYMWAINRTYRLVSEEKYDEDAIYYLNDEFGSSINHSDVPNCCLFPFIFAKNNKFEEDMITYSLLWPKKNINKGEEIFIDYLANISENEERSSRLTCWYKTPNNYFEKKFLDKLKSFDKIKNENRIKKFEEDINTLIEKDKNGKEISEEDLKNVFNFELFINDKEKKIKIEDVYKKIREAISNYNTKKENSAEYFNKNFNKTDKKIKVCSDLSYVRDNLKFENIELTNNVKEADIVWLNANIFDMLDYNGIIFKNEGKHVFINQYPYESIITMKSYLSNLIQNNFGINDILGLSYDMRTELAEIIGNYYYNEDKGYENIWILKPINMSRSMDMLITDNLKEIIRAVETGPKICQKYFCNPYLMNNKKFDLRFIIAVKSLLPLELYFYDKMFWIRSANKDYNKESLSFDDYEVHFTVMNYSKFGMQTIYDKDFIKYLKERNIEWEPIYNKLKNKVKNVMLLACKDCPQMINYNSRAIYGLDAMIDDQFEPHIIEINYQPDCTRACKFIPEFYNDIFSTLFFEKDSGMVKV